VISYHYATSLAVLAYWSVASTRSFTIPLAPVARVGRLLAPGGSNRRPAIAPGAPTTRRSAGHLLISYTRRARLEIAPQQFHRGRAGAADAEKTVHGALLNLRPGFPAGDRRFAHAEPVRELFLPQPYFLAALKWSPPAPRLCTFFAIWPTCFPDSTVIKGVTAAGKFANWAGFFANSRLLQSWWACVRPDGPKIFAAHATSTHFAKYARSIVK